MKNNTNLGLDGMRLRRLTDSSTKRGHGQGMQEFFLKKVATNDACAHPDPLKTRINFHGFLPWPPSEGSSVDLKARILWLQRRAGGDSLGTWLHGHHTCMTTCFLRFLTFSNGDTRIDMKMPIRQIWCRSYQEIKRKPLARLADNMHRNKLPGTFS